MKKICVFLLFVMLGISACDLQPKIVALPDTVGEFITARYPTLLADPTAQPEIYNSAAIDYGVYASPELYGSSGIDDYVLYSSVDDYIVPPQPEEDMAEPASADMSGDAVDEDTYDFSSDDVLLIPDQQEEVAAPDNDEEDIAWDENSKTNDQLDIPMYGGDAYTEIIVAKGDTLYLLGKKYNMTVDEIAQLNNLVEPYTLFVGQKLRVRISSEQVVSGASKVQEKKPEEKPAAKPDVSHKTTTRVDIGVITVAPGDTLYSLSRKYSIPVNDLAVMNNLSAPFALYAGQQLKVPDLASAPIRLTTKPDAVSQKTNVVKQPNKQELKSQTKQTVQKQDKPAQKVQQQDNKKVKQQKPAPKAKSTTSTVKKPTITARSSSQFSWPVRGKILSNYGAKTNGLFNDGINIAAPVGTSVLAAENGVVAYAGNEVKGMGNLVIIQHSDGWMTVYAHMDSMAVHRGARVRVGQKIGAVGKTGKVDKSQLHFEVRKGTKAYNPIQYLKK